MRSTSQPVLSEPTVPVVIEARVKGTGVGSSNGVLSFDPQIHNQRGALLLANGLVYITWGSHCDSGPYHGWIMGYDAETLTQVLRRLPPQTAKAAVFGNQTPALPPMRPATSTLP